MVAIAVEVGHGDAARRTGVPGQAGFGRDTPERAVAVVVQQLVWTAPVDQPQVEVAVVVGVEEGAVDGIDVGRRRPHRGRHVAPPAGRRLPPDGRRPVAEQRDVQQTVVVDVAPERSADAADPGERVGGVDCPDVPVVHQHGVGRVAGDGVGEEEVDLAVAIEVGNGDGARRGRSPRATHCRWVSVRLRVRKGCPLSQRDRRRSRGRRGIERDGHRQRAHPRVLELGHLGARVALERLELRQPGRRLVGPAQALQRLEGAVGGAAQPRVEGLGLVEPHQGLLGSAGQQRLAGEIGRGRGRAGTLDATSVSTAAASRVAPGMEPQQAQRVPGPRADGGIAHQRGQQTLGLGVIGLGLTIDAGEGEVHADAGVGRVRGGQRRERRHGAGEVVLAHLRDAAVDRGDKRRVARGLRRRRGSPARRGEQGQQGSAGDREWCRPEHPRERADSIARARGGAQRASACAAASACSCAWYELRTSGPASTCTKPRPSAIRFNSANSSGW